MQSGRFLKRGVIIQFRI